MMRARYFDIIRYPVNTEASNQAISNSNSYTFIVDKKASKAEIKQAIENVFDVKVVAVNTMIRKGKRKVFRGKEGKRSDEKRAMVKLAVDSKIDLGTGV